jgi:hypothetical protein
MNNQDRMNAAKQISQRQKNMVMIGAGQINNISSGSVVLALVVVLNWT